MSQRIVAPLQNLYELRPCLASYTENYVDAGWGMYAGVRQGLAELSLFEDIVQSGSVASGDVGICKRQTIQSSESTSSDIWMSAGRVLRSDGHLGSGHAADDLRPALQHLPRGEARAVHRAAAR